MIRFDAITTPYNPKPSSHVNKPNPNQHKSQTTQVNDNNNHNNHSTITDLHIHEP
ncbi:hypothetical protein HanPSC8_Chr08g0335241 [Helianthus annuus]|nr:hypothetical protein HanPSC8_Chr08g0335241 [Helianthus annuus]